MPKFLVVFVGFVLIAISGCGKPPQELKEAQVTKRKWLTEANQDHMTIHEAALIGYEREVAKFAADLREQDKKVIATITDPVKAAELSERSVENYNRRIATGKMHADAVRADAKRVDTKFNAAMEIEIMSWELLDKGFTIEQVNALSQSMAKIVETFTKK